VRPDLETLLAVAIFDGGVLAVAGADESDGIFGDVEGLLQMIVVDAIAVSELAQEVERELAEVGKTVLILFEIANM